MKRKIIYWIIILNLIWAASAIVYDWDNLSAIPYYLWPSLIICPVYPLLLFLTWASIYRQKKCNDYLLAFAAIPSIVYLIASMIYYPAWMAYNGFNWLAFGQIYWVAVYGLQGIYLYLNMSIAERAKRLVALFLVISLIVQYLNIERFGLFDFSAIDDAYVMAFVIVLIVLSIILGFSRPSNRKV